MIEYDTFLENVESEFADIEAAYEYRAQRNIYITTMSLFFLL